MTSSRPVAPVAPKTKAWCFFILIKIRIHIFKRGTLYSFRHTGAIEIFKRTGSIHKLEKVMGHSSLNVSLTNLRGLEVAELKEDDTPMV